MEILVGVDPELEFAVERGLDSFVLEVECQEKEEVYDLALDYLKEYLIDGFRDKGLDISIITDDFDDFMDWVAGNSDNFDEYINSYIIGVVRSFPHEATLTGWWYVYKGRIDEKMCDTIDKIVKKSINLEDFIDRLRDAPEVNDAWIVDDSSPPGIDQLVKSVVKDAIRAMKKTR